VANRPLVEAALGYAARGVPVFPCRADTKRPHTAHDFKDASTDTRQIEVWWQRWPDAMIGCPTGPEIGAWTSTTLPFLKRPVL
jgi:hypothetical protein